MPRVPVYEGLRSDIAVQPQVQLRAPNTTAISEGAIQRGEAVTRGLEQAGNVASRIAVGMQNDANQVRVNDGMNALVKARTALQVDLLAQKGKNALERPDGKSLVDEYEERLGKEIEGLSASLGNDAQRLAFQQQADQLRNQFRGVAVEHMVREQGEYKKQTRVDTIEAAQRQAVLLWGDTSMREQSVAAITGTIDTIAQENGWDKVTRDNALVEAITPMHAGVIKAMIQAGKAGDAKAYYDANSAGMTLQARAAVQDTLQRAVVAQESDAGAAALWAQHGPKLPTDPVKIFDMEQEARKQYAGDPDKLDGVITRLRSMAQGFNAQQSELRAAHVSGVWKLVDDGAPMTQVMRSDAWLGLSDTDQHEILRSIEAERATRAQRQASEEQRDLARMERQDRLNLMRNADAYLTATDPTVLARMSRAQVEALRTKFGREATEHLLSKWDGLRNPTKLAEAKMDAEDFNVTAEGLGLKPFDPKKSEDERAALGNLKYRVEQLIDVEQTQRGRALTRQEKQELMRREMATKVVVDGLFGGKQVPVIALTPEQLRKVQVPPADYAQAMQALQLTYARTGDPAMRPTDENVRRLYLRKISPAGNLIPNGQ